MIFKDKRIPYAGAAAVFLAAASVAMLLLACRAESPAEGLGGGWETVKQACDTLAKSDYDAVRVTTFESTDVDDIDDIGKVVETVAFSGGDFRRTFEAYAPDGETLIGKGELVVKDGVNYGRESYSDDEPDTLGDWEVSTEERPPFLLTMPCFGAGEAGKQFRGFR